MDAIKYSKEKARMTNECNILCGDCPVYAFCNSSEGKNAEKMVSIVEKWVEEHPPKTRQSEFLEMFPNTEVGTNGVLKIFPCWIDGKKRDGCYKRPCVNCTRDYWLAEVE